MIFIVLLLLFLASSRPLTPGRQRDKHDLYIAEGLNFLRFWPINSGSPPKPWGSRPEYCHKVGVPQCSGSHPLQFR